MQMFIDLRKGRYSNYNILTQQMKERRVRNNVIMKRCYYYIQKRIEETQRVLLPRFLNIMQYDSQRNYPGYSNNSRVGALGDTLRIHAVEWKVVSGKNSHHSGREGCVQILEAVAVRGEKSFMLSSRWNYQGRQQRGSKGVSRKKRERRETISVCGWCAINTTTRK